MKAGRRWAAHLGPELRCRGSGQLKLVLLNEILGCSRFAPSVFGCQAPGAGDEILAHYGTQQMFPSARIPALREEARRKLADRLEHLVANEA